MAAYKKGVMSKPIGSTARPIQGSSITIGESIGSSKSQIPAIGQSYNNIMGGGSFGGKMLDFTPSSMGSLEAASMRLADAASRRGIAERESEAELGAKSSGYSSLGEMQRDIRSKRREQEAETKKQKEEEDMTRRGYVKVGGRWVMPVR